MASGLSPTVDGWLLAGATLRLILAAVLGGAIGLEREVHDKPAGFRTHVLVCVGAALVMLVSTSFVSDSARIAAQVVSGIGFLGAGTIIRRGDVTVGLTTAASLWAAAGVGLAAGHPSALMELLAIIATGLVLLTLVVFPRLEVRLLRRPRVRVINVTANLAGELVPEAGRVVEALGGVLVSAHFQPAVQGASSLELVAENLPSSQIGVLVARLSQLPGVQSVRVDTR